MKPWQYWMIFLASFGVVLLAMGWISIMALSLERGQAYAAQQAAVEEKVRLALWRMENALSPMLARESARPYGAYASFYPVERAYTKTFDEIGQSEILIASPLLTESVPTVILHFQIDPDEHMSSPKVPSAPGRDKSISAFGNGPMIDRSAARLREFETRIDRRRLRVEVLDRKRETLRGQASEEARPEANIMVAAAAAPAATREEAEAAVQTLADQSVALQEAGPRNADAPPAQAAAISPQVVAKETQKNALEWNSRSQLQQKAMNNAQADWVAADAESASGAESVGHVQKAKVPRAKGDVLSKSEDVRSAKVSGSKAPAKAQALSAKSGAPKERVKEPPSVTVREGVMKPLWIGDMLLLARRVTVSGKDYVQGCWLDWDGIRKELLEQVRDLLPAADLAPAGNVERDMEGRLLAGLPLRLVPGRTADAPLKGMTPVRVALVIAWTCVLIGAGAVGVLLAGVVTLSERRASFVSAVTHELRTPLTTFRMYAEMLSEGMVPDEARRKEYLSTLCAEGNRLSHLVENVLAYARIERGRARGHTEVTTAGDIIGRLKDRLEQRTAQAGLSLVVDENGEAQALQVRTDVSAVDQILFNLVDNACKYAANGGDKRIHLETAQENGSLCLRVRDHGPGISAEDAKRLFRPFSKSAKHAAETAPGVGLGLALSRRLARQMKGDLRICPRVTDGACLELILPAV